MVLFTTAPARRIPYHLDGSQVSWVFNNGATNIATQTQLNNINDIENGYDGVTLGSISSVSGCTMTIGIVFPYNYNITNYFLYVPIQNVGGYTNSTISLTKVKISTDTTNGINGTWTTLTTPSNGILSKITTTYNLSATEWFDNTQVSGNLTGAINIKGINFELSCSVPSSTSTFNLNTLTLWGNINDSSATKRLAVTDNTGTELTKDITPTAVKRNNTSIVSLYYKNLHTAPTTKIDFSIDGEITAVNNAVTISVDGGTTYNALPYTWTTALASNAVSSEVKVKYTVPLTETYGYKYYGIKASPTF